MVSLMLRIYFNQRRTQRKNLGLVSFSPGHVSDEFSNVDDKIVTNIDVICDENLGRYAGDKAWIFYENDEIKGQFKEEHMRLWVV